jgi:uncharacterized RDD family membrane protein YckC
LSKPAAVSTFYERRRRLAYGFAAASILLMLAQSYLGFSSETFADPHAGSGPDGLRVSHRVIAPGDDPGAGTRLLLLDAGLGIRNRLAFSGDAGGILVEGEEITTFFGKGATVHRGGNSIRHFELDQTWDVREAVLDAPHTRAWIFGWSGGAIVARRREGESWSSAITVQKSGKIDGLTAAMDGDKGPFVAWSEVGSTIIKAAAFDGASFVPRAEFDLGLIDSWEVVPVRGRLLALAHRREDRTFRSVTLRLQCCKECGQPPPPDRITFEDPALAFGRIVTGLAAGISGDDLVIFITRGSVILAESSLQAGRAPIGTFLPPPGAPLVSVGTEPLWRRVAGNLYPSAMFFCAVALVSLGFVMFRERRRAVLATSVPPRPGPPVSEIVPRLLAHLLDTMILSPVVLVTADLLNWLPVVRVTEQIDSTARLFLAAKALFQGPFFPLMAAFLLAYYVPMEALLGWTPGKRILGLRVAALDGSRASPIGVVFRTLFRLVDNFPFIPIGLVVMIKTPRRQRIGDLVGRTIVIQDRGDPKMGGR